MSEKLLPTEAIPGLKLGMSGSVALRRPRRTLLDRKQRRIGPIIAFTFALIAGPANQGTMAQGPSLVAGREVRVVSLKRLSSASIGKQNYPSPGNGLVEITIEVSGGIKESLKDLKPAVLESAVTDSEGQSYRSFNFIWSGSSMRIDFETRRNPELKTLRLGDATFDLSNLPHNKRVKTAPVEGVALALPWERPLTMTELTLRDGDRVEARARTDDSGRFRFGDVLPGLYRIWLEGTDVHAVEPPFIRVDTAGPAVASTGRVYLPDMVELAYLRGICESSPGRLSTAGRGKVLAPGEPNVAVLSREPGLKQLMRSKNAGDWMFDRALHQQLAIGQRAKTETVVCVTIFTESVGYYQGPSGGVYDRSGAVKVTWRIRLVRPGSGTVKETTVRKDPPPTLPRTAPPQTPIDEANAWLTAALSES